MNRLTHAIYVWTMTLIVVIVTAYLCYVGWDYYNTPLEERFYHERHNWFKPSGVGGHGLGIVGTLMMVVGVVVYIARKRWNFMVRQLRLKYLLEFHIFLCTLGPILVLFHTAFKFGGIVSVAFWSMVAVVVSGVIGRFIYIQIPHSIEGRALTLSEVKNMRAELAETLREKAGLDEASAPLIFATDTDLGNTKQGFFKTRFEERKTISTIRRKLNKESVPGMERRKIVRMVKEEFALAHRIGRLKRMQQLFKYWHVAHLPFALIMLIILIVHVAVTLALGYKWIF